MQTITLNDGVKIPAVGFGVFIVLAACFNEAKVSQAI